VTEAQWLRLFVALELPAAAREALAAWREAHLAGERGMALRPIPAGDLHLTLCFLGAQPADAAESIAAACRGVGGWRAPTLWLDAPVWLPRRRPRVLAVALADPEGELRAVQSTLSGALVAGGWFTPESRPFFPHVTVARVRAQARVKAHALQPPEPLEVRGERITLFRSQTRPTGAVYEPLATVALDLGV
jgi:RNA 2',3'-cyclic 3'-phosphodiesterase